MTVRRTIRNRIKNLDILIKDSAEKKDAKMLAESLIRKNECQQLLKKI